ncbi:MAG: L-2-amino-thiazoline-4-carboxylic acid hydrolase [Candidatus Lokiarchaeota archaeon]|nr:L-2-amino-thiazoline-4-carboxylic acid hydrolase [Candidatus Lokiarchaeota archaeon]
MREVNQDDKLFFFERSFITLDGLWMIETEEMTNWEVALKIDVIVWKKLLKVIIRRLKKYLRLEKNDLTNLIKILTFRWSIEGWKYSIIQQDAGKVKILVNQCPYKSAMDRNPERREKQSLICKNMCIPFYKAITKDYNKNIDLERTRYMGLGDDYCDFTFSFDSKSLEEAESGDSFKEIIKPNKADKLFYFEKNFRTLDGLWVIESENELGWDATLKLDIIVWQRLYKIVFRRVIKYLNIKENTLSDLIEILSFVWNCEGNIHEINQNGEKIATINIVECPYIEAMKRNPDRHNRIESICKEMCIPYLQPVIKEFNPKIEIKREKFIGLGDSVCDFILNLEE